MLSDITEVIPNIADKKLWIYATVSRDKVLQDSDDNSG